MTYCEDCQRASRDLRCYRMFSLGCVTCGARLLWVLQRMRIPPEQKRERLRVNLADWVARGHSERELRALAAQDWEGWARELDSRNRSRP